MTLEVKSLVGEEMQAVLPDLARLRMIVFRDWPYLYDGILAHERQYVASYRDHPGALMMGAFDLGRLVGASTSSHTRQLPSSCTTASRWPSPLAP